MSLPKKQGLYDPHFEHDACGIGMLVNIDGRKNHHTVTEAIEILKKLKHRGGVGNEPESGDGAGILIQIAHGFMSKAAENEGFILPEEGGYGVAMIFASPDEDICQNTLNRFCGIIETENMEVIGLREVPIFKDNIGHTAKNVCPGINQVFIKRPLEMSGEDFERKLYVIGRVAQRKIRYCGEGSDPYFYLSSISSKTIVYKGMLLPEQLSEFYPDLKDRDMKTAIALVHSRFSTNTFPSWERAHPMHYIIHNGEINTIKGNVNWVKARESMLSSGRFEGDDFKKALPVINEDGSDSSMLDDFISMLIHSGYSCEEAVMLAIPEPWEKDTDMDKDKRAYYQYNSCLMEAWDGPAAVAFTDGVIAGATLDRNGLRPARYYLTKDNRLILSSEVGVLPVDEADIVKKDRLRPGKMLLIDICKGKLLSDEEIKGKVINKNPYEKWLKNNLTCIDDLEEGKHKGDTWEDVIGTGSNKIFSPLKMEAILKSGIDGRVFSKGKKDKSPAAKSQIRKVFGYTWEDVNLTLKGILEKGEDPVSAMGTDTPLAVLSNRPQLLYNYFQQMFAQVTNPPIDAIREQLITSSSVQLGSEGNLLERCEDNCRMISHDTPVLLPEEFEKLKAIDAKGFKAVTLSMMFSSKLGLKKALEALFFAADISLESGYNLLMLSDRGADENCIPIPALLASAGLHHHLVRNGTRTRVSIIVDTGEAREVHHIAALVGYGVNAVNPYLAYEITDELASDMGIEKNQAERTYRDAVTKGIVKIMSKMGISTVRSYHGAQIFEALGVSAEVIDKYFTGTTTRIGGLTLQEIENESRTRHETAFIDTSDELETGGEYKWRRQGEYHLLNPENIFYLQHSCRIGDYNLFKKFTECINLRTRELKNIRGLLSINTAEKPVPLKEVESAENIVKRFKTGAMSYGSISKEAHECMAVAMNRLGGKSNTGEGGEMAERFIPGVDGNNRSSAIKQVASGRFGVTIDYLNNAYEIQIKMAQGAKPGEGGQLPGKKVYPWIAKNRYSVPGVDLISPPPHHDIYSIEDLAQLIHDLKNANPSANISVKLVSEAGVGTIAVGVAKGLADIIVISGYDGGTGAASRTSIRHAGLPWELGVAEANQTLLLNGLRDKVVLETDGKLLSGRDIVIAALLGAEEFAFATAPLIVMGCDMMRVCNLDTCPVGIATQNPDLRAKFAGKPEYVENLMLFLAREVREIMAKIGVCKFEDLVGHVELLRERHSEINDKAKTVDLSGLLYQPKAVSTAKERYRTRVQNHMLNKTLDMDTLIPLCKKEVYDGGAVRYSLHADNTNRTIGTILSSEVTKVHGAKGLPEDKIFIEISGSAGQSLGAFLAPGITLELTGDCNDYIGKGLSGGKIIVKQSKRAEYDAGENIAVGNVALYGATSGQLFINGIAGERFCVRNSGAIAVVEGTGDHGCEYMTGGKVVILGDTGRNFGAGMSGGVAYIYDRDGTFKCKCSKSRLTLSVPGKADMKELRELLEKHIQYTQSKRAVEILENFSDEKNRFIKVVPEDYARMTYEIEKARRTEKTDEDALLLAFSRVTNGVK